MTNKSLNKNKDIILLRRLALKLLSSQNNTHGLRRSLGQLLKELVLYKNHNDYKKNQIIVKNKFCFKNIQIGGGGHLLRGFLNIDIVPPADLICDVREGLPLKSSCAEFIFSEHFLEHIDYPKSTRQFLKECYRVLKKNGKLIIGVPDSKIIIEAYAKKDQKIFKKFVNKWYKNRNCLEHLNTYIDLINYHFRDQDDDDKYHPHFWGYDQEKLESLLREVGFSRVGLWRFDPKIANPKRKFGSVYVFGVK